jgi:hypothetical protein
MEQQLRLEEAYGRGWKAGLASILTICNSPPGNLANRIVEDDDEGVPKKIRDVIMYMTQDEPAAPTLPTTLWTPPEYSSAYRTLTSLPSSSRVQLIGRYSGQPVYAGLYLQCQSQGYGRDFYGLVKVDVRGDVQMAEVMGTIRGTSTMLLVLSDDSVMAYNCPWPIDPPFPGIECAAKLKLGGEELEIQEKFGEEDITVERIDLCEEKIGSE